MPDQRVVWNLAYQYTTPEHVTTFRHHFEVLRQDAHVESVTATERADDPHSLMMMRVVFREGFDRPDSQELRFADATHSTRITHLERVIQMLEPLSPPFRAPTGSISAARRAIASTRDHVPEAIQGVVEALRAPVGDGLAHALSCPKWVHTGGTYQLKTPAGNKDSVVQITQMRVSASSGVTVDLCSLDGLVRTIWLEEFISLYEPHEPEQPRVIKTAWDHVLVDDED